MTNFTQNLWSVCEGDGQWEEDETAAVRHRNLSPSCRWLRRPNGYADTDRHKSRDEFPPFMSGVLVCLCHREQRPSKVLHWESGQRELASTKSHMVRALFGFLKLALIWLWTNILKKLEMGLNEMFGNCCFGFFCFVFSSYKERFVFAPADSNWIIVT